MDMPSCLRCGAHWGYPHAPDCPTLEPEHARDDAKDEEGQKGSDVADHEGILGREAAQRLEDRPEGHVPEAGGSDRLVTVGAEQSQWFRTPQELEADIRQQEEAARQRAVLAAPRIRIHLKDGAFVDCAVLIPWPDWMRQLMMWHGVMFDNGWIPADLIKLIAPLTTPESKGELPQNVVPFRKPQ